MAKRKIDLIPGTDQDSLIIAIIVACGVYIATGGGAPERWRESVTFGGPPTAALWYGKKKEEITKEKAKKEGFEQGYNTLNPALHFEEIVKAANSPIGDAAAAVGRTVGTAVAEEVAGRGVDYAIDQAQSWFEDPGRQDKKERKRGRGR